MSQSLGTHKSLINDVDILTVDSTHSWIGCYSILNLRLTIGPKDNEE